MVDFFKKIIFTSPKPVYMYLFICMIHFSRISLKLARSYSRPAVFLLLQSAPFQFICIFYHKYKSILQTRLQVEDIFFPERFLC